ncbi:hypothetical protein Ddc_02807 [Ditylenchus destructor]|nr:hypothetical protein Ddc_02807 [Ditylenchus destructor]
MQHFRAPVTFFPPNGSGQVIAQSIALSEPSKMGYRATVTERCKVRYRHMSRDCLGPRPGGSGRGGYSRGRGGGGGSGNEVGHMSRDCPTGRN